MTAQQLRETEEEMRAQIRAEWGKVTPYRMGLKAAELSQSFPCPYKNYRSIKCFADGFNYARSQKAAIDAALNPAREDVSRG